MDWELYPAAEDAAKSHRRELWAEPHGIPPWEWRGTHGNQSRIRKVTSYG